MRKLRRDKTLFRIPAATETGIGDYTVTMMVGKCRPIALAGGRNVAVLVSRSHSSTFVIARSAGPSLPAPLRCDLGSLAAPAHRSARHAGFGRRERPGVEGQQRTIVGVVGVRGCGRPATCSQPNARPRCRNAVPTPRWCSRWRPSQGRVATLRRSTSVTWQPSAGVSFTGQGYKYTNPEKLESHRIPGWIKRMFGQRKVKTERWFAAGEPWFLR